MTARRLTPLPALAVGAAAFLCFLPALGGDFVWDDLTWTNPIYDSMTWSSWLGTFFHPYLHGYQPLVWLTHKLDYALWGLNPAGHHLTNLLLHALNAALFYALSLRLLELSRLERGREEAAVFAALLWAVHPMRVEAVAWVTQRGYLLPGTFCLLSVWAYLARRPGFSLALFALSLLSRSVAAALPAVLLALDLYPLRRWGATMAWTGPAARRAWLEKVPYLLLSAGAVALSAWGRYDYGTIASLGQWSLPTRLVQVPFSCVFYLEKTLMPLPVSPFYDVLPAVRSLGLGCLLRVAAFLALTAYCLARARSRPAFLAAWAAYLAFLSPFSGLTKYGDAWRIVSDRWSYLACMPLCVLAGGGLSAAWPAGKARRWVPVVAASAVAALAVLTWRQTGVWRTEIRLWSWSVATDPGDPVPHEYLAEALAEKGRLTQALEESSEAIRLDPEYAAALNNKGVILARLGRVREAQASFREALRLAPGSQEARRNLARALGETPR